MGKLIEKVISHRLQFHLSANGFLDPNQLEGISQRLTTDAGMYLTHLIRTGWIKECHTSVIAFDIAQFFPSLNHNFLLLCLAKAGLNANVLKFFRNYHFNRFTTYAWNNFVSQKFATSVGVGQGSALSSILSTIYLAPIIKTFKNRIKNLKEKIPTDILSFVDNGLLISQKSYELSSAFLLSSYNMISKILSDAGLVMEHSKSEVFHFTQARNLPNPSIDLTSVGGPLLHPKPIWRYLGFFFNRKLNFHHYVHHYVIKCLSTLNAMKMLGNSSRGLLPMQKRLLYRTCIIPIALYDFQLWFFKGVPMVKNITELKKMQQRAALWITGAFRTSPSEGVEAIAGLIPINLHLKKLNGRHHLRYATIPPSHVINALLDKHQSKNQNQHKFALANLTNKQKSKLKSPIKDVSERLNKIKNEFDPHHIIFHPGLYLVDHFSSRIVFHSPDSSSNEALFDHSSKLNLVFEKTQKSSNDIAVISDGSIKAVGSATAIAHIWKDYKVNAQLKAHANNITPLEAKLMAICIGLTAAFENSEAQQILVITDSLKGEKKIISSGDQYLQKSIIPIAEKIQSFLSKDNCNAIHFWHCPNKIEWSRHTLVDKEAKSSHIPPILSKKNSFLLSKKLECNRSLKSWQKSFKDSKKKGQLFLEFKDDNDKVIKPTYAKGGSWLTHIGISNSVCARFTRMMLEHASIGEYWQRFFPNTPIQCPCGEADIEMREHIVMQCRRYDTSFCPRDIRISSFVEFIIGNPTLFCFDNS